MILFCHDWWHIARVRSLALRLANLEGLPADALEAVELAALLHDVNDWKYAREGQDLLTAPNAIQDCLETAGAAPDLTARVLAIVAGVGFKDELGALQRAVSPELAVVQDADRLDALGAVGIARCFTYGGRFRRPLHDPGVLPRESLTREAYTDARCQQTTINHFHEKLLRLQGMMKTACGRRMAEQRTAYMREFLQRFDSEWRGEL
ncbi:hypothetical protein WJX81_003221 [Elliptochloris bilobata]|uniref:HD/PDEase domain-containing protein n=1 Tax=Elliptochloris bilobata TaxID=381761 RepID=A0AAW1SJ19_9CHLO